MIDSQTKPLKTKQDKYNPLISAIKEQGWIVNPLIIITA